MITTEKRGTYTYIESNDIAVIVDRELKSLGMDYYSTAGRNGLIQWRLPDVQVKDGDSILNGQVYLRNGSEPGRALTLLIGAYRFICSNGLVIGIGEGGKVIHRTGDKVDNFVSQIPTMIRNGLINLESNLQDAIEENRAIKIVDPIDVVGSLPIQKTVKDTVIGRIVSGTTRENVNDAWGLYNEVNEITRKRSVSWSTAIAKDVGLLEHIQLLAAA